MRLRSGQASLDLAEHFGAVAATDASESRLAAARPHPRVSYRQAPAGASGLADGSVDLITAATALHRLDQPRFSAEAHRVLKPGGVLAAFELAVDWPMARLMGYLGSWSATARHIAAHGDDPVKALAEELTPFRGDPERTRRIRWPLHIRVGRVARIPDRTTTELPRPRAAGKLADYRFKNKEPTWAA